MHAHGLAAHVVPSLYGQSIHHARAYAPLHSTLHLFLPSTHTHTNTHTQDYDQRRRRCHTPPQPAFLNSFIYVCWVSVEVLTAFLGINGVLVKNVVPVRRHCCAAHTSGQQPARRCAARSNVVLLAMAEQNESCIRLIQATPSLPVLRQYRLI